MKQSRRRPEISPLVLVCLATVALVPLTSCRKSPVASELEGGRLQESVQTQKSINRYFHDSVVPKLKPCWERLTGSGGVEMTYVYAREGDAWSIKTVEIGRSDLPQDQHAAATTCMREAVAGTPLTVTGSGDTYTLHWTWPVPLPPDAEAQFARMLNDNGGGEGTGCDGHGAAPRCVTCAGRPLSCIAVCVGGDPPCQMTENPIPGGFPRTCTIGSGCASGGLRGVVGGVMRF